MGIFKNKMKVNDKNT